MAKTTTQNLTPEEKSQVVITPEDCQECAKFFEFFEIPVPEKLKIAFENFIQKVDFVSQEELKWELSEVITHSDHPVFKDEVFTQVRPECSGVNQELAFDRQLAEQLTSDAE